MSRSIEYREQLKEAICNLIDEAGSAADSNTTVEKDALYRGVREAIKDHDSLPEGLQKELSERMCHEIMAAVWMPKAWIMKMGSESEVLR